MAAPAALAAPKNLQNNKAAPQTLAPVVSVSNTVPVQVAPPDTLITADEVYESPFAVNPDQKLNNAFMSSLKIGRLTGLKY